MATKEENGDITAARKKVRIREMEIDDLPDVFHLGEKLFEAEKVPNLYRTWDEYEVVELFNGDTESCLVAEIDDRMVGFALGTTITKTHSAWKYGHLVWLAVDHGHQRLGIAEKLFNRFRALMLQNNVRMLIVDTEAENLPALHFFRKMGFRNPQQHIYLTLNLASEQQAFKRKQNGRFLEARRAQRGLRAMPSDAPLAEDDDKYE
jgi:ribosomal protein S18 acetylase RimI-like enzyme